MNENVIPFPDDPQRRPAATVPCPTNSLVTHLVLLDGRVVHECHETLGCGLADEWAYSDSGYDSEANDDANYLADDACARLERKYGRSYQLQQPTPEQIVERKAASLREFVGGEAVLAGLDDVPLHDADDLRISAQRPWMPAVDQVDAMMQDVAQQWFDAETLVALQRAMLILLDQQEPCVQEWSAALTVGATVWAVGTANGLLGPLKVIQRDVLHSLGIETWISQQGGTVARLLRTGTVHSSSGSGPWGPSGYPHTDPGAFQKLTPLGRPELLLERVSQT